MRPVTGLVRRLRSRSDSSCSDERGFILVWYALLIFVMLGVTAFAVDLGHAYLVGQQEQDAADAAALSAASYLPDNCVNANPHAQTIASVNGFTNGAANTQVTAVNGAAGAVGCNNDPTLSPNQIRVNVRRKVDTWFARAIGIDTLTVSRTSVAEYDPPVALGSPTSFFGTAPGCTTCLPDPHIWASVDGRANRKVDGNAISAEWCASDNPGSNPAPYSTADNCKDLGRSNTDLDTSGMLFQISNPNLESLNVELYDPGFIAASDRPGTQTVCADGSTYPFCTGESTLTVQNGATTPVATKYTLYPLDSLTNPLGNASICTITYPGYKTVADAAAATNPVTFRSYHKWANLAADAGCPALTGSSYVLQVQSTDDLGGPVQAGSNMFSLAACSGCNPNLPTNDPNVAISAITKMSLFTNASNANPEFYLARVPSWAKGQSLTLTFFDIGDINGPGGPVGGALKVVAVDATHGPGGPLVDEFAGCRYSHPESRGNAASGYLNDRPSPWDPDAKNIDWADNGSLSNLPGGGCTAQVTLNGSTGASFWNGKWATFDVPIPNDYTCNDADFTKCWLKIKYAYPVGSNLHDATTWTASLSGNPVRLTK